MQGKEDKPYQWSAKGIAGILERPEYTVPQAEKAAPSGNRRQKTRLVWNFIGEVNLPNDNQTIERQRKSRTA